MGNDIIVYEAPQVDIKSYRSDYLVSINDKQASLKRDVDFGKITRKDGSAITKRPCLYKAGAHKILTLFGLRYTTEMVKEVADFEKGYFYYVFKCTAYYGDMAVRTGWGCANTNEKSSGFASAYDVANTKLKLAEKRAEVDLAIKLADASGWFTQDIDDEDNEQRAKEILSDNDPITPKQIKRIFAIAANNEITAEKAKQLLVSKGYASTKDIKQKDYDEVVEYFEKYNENK